MEYIMLIFCLSFTVKLALLANAACGMLRRDAGHTNGGVHLPLHRREASRVRRRDGDTGEVALGDFMDVTYNVLVQVDNTILSLVADTGSSDLWAISDDSGLTPPSGVSLYPHDDFLSGGLGVHLVYGDSHTGTHADGVIGKANVSLAGLMLQDQYFVAINNTNTSVLETGSAGIFGLGFPSNSLVWAKVFKNQSDAVYQSSSSREETESLQGSVDLGSSLATRLFPDLTFLRPFATSIHSHPNEQSHRESLISTLLKSYASLGPFLSRLAETKAIAAPMFTITLQRDTIDVGGNIGLLSIGELPERVKNDTLTWTRVRGYTTTQGGLSGPPDSPSEVYPISWEIFLDDVFLDGERLPRSKLSSPDISLSALIDTGNSLIRGPSDIIQSIHTRIGGARFPCSTPHTLAFQIGGQMFPVDPRDFVSQAFMDSVAECSPNIAATDPPKEGTGFLYSWSLGDPFLKSVVASFYYGNLSYPSRDPPRIGLLSTVPPNADDRMEAAVASASSHGGNFPVTSETTSRRAPTMAQLLRRPRTRAGSTSGSSRSGIDKLSLGFAFVLILWTMSLRF